MICVITGRVGKDAIVLENNSCIFSLATTKKGYTNKNGETYPDQTIWFSVFAHKNIAPYIKKGDSLVVYTDWLDTSIYEDNVELSCRAMKIEFMAKGNNNNANNESYQPPF